MKVGDEGDLRKDGGSPTRVEGSTANERAETSRYSAESDYLGESCRSRPLSFYLEQFNTYRFPNQGTSNRASKQTFYSTIPRGHKIAAGCQVQKLADRSRLYDGPDGRQL